MLSTRIRSSSKYKWWAFAALGIGTFQSVVAHNSIIVVLPIIADHFDTDLATVQWVVLGELLVLSSLLLPMGRLSDILGRKQIYTAGLLVFLVGLLLAGFSTYIGTLIASKVLQGVGSAMSQGTAMAMIISAFPNKERGKALGLNLSVVGTGGITGPIVGGIIAGAFGWRWVFFMSIPVGIVAFLASMIILDNRFSSQADQRPRFDWLGAALSAGTLMIFLLALTNAYRIGWGSPPIVAAFLGCGILAAAFIWWELRTTSPMLDLRLFQNKLFSMGVAAGFFSFMGMHSMRFLMPFYLFGVLGYSVGQVGLIMVPNAICMIFIGPMSGRLSDRYGFRKLNMGGAALAATGVFLLAWSVDSSSSLGLVMLAMVLQSSGAGIFNSPNHTAILSTVPRIKYGVVSALLSLSRVSAQATSIAVVTVIVTATMASMGYVPNIGEILDSNDPGLFDAFNSGVRTAYLTIASLLVVALSLSALKGGQRGQDPDQEPVQVQSQVKDAQPR